MLQQDTTNINIPDTGTATGDTNNLQSAQPDAPSPAYQPAYYTNYNKPDYDTVIYRDFFVNSKISPESGNLCFFKLFTKPHKPAENKNTTGLKQHAADKPVGILDNTLADVPYWTLGIMLFALVITAFLRFTYHRLFNHVISAFYHYPTSNRLFQGRNAVFTRFSVIFNLLFIINSGLFVYQTCLFYNITIPGIAEYQLYLAITGALAGFFILKIIIYKISGMLFLTSNAINEFLHNMFIYYKTFGLLLIPVTISIAFMEQQYVPYIIKGTAIVFILFFLLQIIRGIIISFKNKFSIFYLILYFCILEILPVLVIYKEGFRWFIES